MLARCVVVVLVLLLPGVAPAAPPDFREQPADAALLRQLRGGGFTLYLRHGLTDNSRSDAWPLADPADCSVQRVLSPQGRAQVARIGAALRERRIPVAEVVASPLCRTRETAAAVAPHAAVRLDMQLAYVGNMTAAEKRPNLLRTRMLLASPPPAGSNRLVVGHGPNLMELIGYFPAEGTLVIFQPGPDGPRYLGSVAPDAWDRMAR